MRLETVSRPRHVSRLPIPVAVNYYMLKQRKSVCMYVDVDVRYQEWLEKNKIDHAHQDSEDEAEQMQKRHKRFGQLLSFHTHCMNH